MTVDPSPNRSNPPDFHKLSDDTFEEMSCALYDKEPGISTADLYRIKGQKQFGIDIKAERSDGNGIEVGSCKCYTEVKNGKIPTWSNDFLDCWISHWQEKKVVKFVLIVASLVDSSQREAEIEAEKARFRSLGITYVVWGPRQLQEKLRPYPGLVSQFLGEDFVSRLCGISPSVENPSHPNTEALSADVVSQLGDLQQALSGEVEKRLDTALEEILCGNLGPIEAELKGIQTGWHWTQLAADTQARVFRLQASLHLQRGDIGSAEMLSDKADAICKPVEPRLRAHIAARKKDVETGLEILGSPESRDGLQLQVALLLDADRVKDAVDLLNTHSALQEEHAETERLRAFVALLQDRRKEALAAIRRAEALAPMWPAIKRAGGIVRYACALSPLVAPEWYLYPNPVDLDLVREDDDSRNLLTVALANFEELVSRGQNQELKIVDETWVMACLCNLRDRLNDAEDRCKAVVENEPTHAGAIEWILARGFEFERERSMASLRKQLKDGEGEYSQVLALAWLLATDGQVQEAADVVREFSDRFDSLELQALRDRWLADYSARKACVSTIEEDSLSHAGRMSLLIDHANRTQEWSHLVQFFNELIDHEPPPAITLKVAQLLAENEQWDAIAAHQDALLRFETTEGVRLVAYAAFNKGQTSRVLQILSDHQSVFSSNILPRELRILQIKAQSLIGDKGTALRHASSLAAESTLLSDRLLKADMLVRVGNLSAALPIIREAAKAEVFTSSSALNLAQITALADVGLARNLFHHAKKKGIPETLSATAFELASRLGLDDEVAPFIEQLGRQAQEGADFVKIVTLDELIEQSQLWQEKSANLENTYLKGELPIHLVVSQGNVNIANLYRLSDSETAMDSSFNPIMIRHGARPSNVVIGSPITDWKICIDVTGVLIAAQLEILDYLEQLPHPISISPSLPEALYELEINSQHNQPGRVGTMSKILDAVSAGKITVSDYVQESKFGGLDGSERECAVYQGVASSECLIVDHHLPEKEGGEDVARFTTLRAVVDGLFSAGILDSEIYADGLSKLGAYNKEKKGIPPHPGAHIFFLTNTLWILADAGLLDVVFTNYHVQVDSRLLVMAREEIDRFKHGEETSAWLAALRTRIGEGIEAGRYTTLPECNVVDSGVDEDTREDNLLSLERPIDRCLFDMLKAPSQDGGVIWFDDRNLSGYREVQPQGNLIVGVYEILKAMCTSQLISKSTQQKALLRLRASNAMFLPLEPEEIVDLLSKAPVRDGKVVETPELIVIRRYLARSMLLEEHLKIDGSSEMLKERPVEFPFLMDVRRLSESCIVAQWNQLDMSVECRRARCSWIWSALRVERFMYVPKGPEVGDAGRTFYVVHICALLAGVFQVADDRQIDQAFSGRKAYLRWLDDEVLADKLEADDNIIEDIAKYMEQLLTGILDEDRDAKELIDAESLAIAKRYLRTIVQFFPEKIRKNLHKNNNFCQKLGIKTGNITTLGNVSFKADMFWKSVSRALDRGQARVRTLSDRKQVRIKRVADKESTIQFTGALQCFMSDPAMAVLDRAQIKSGKVFENNPDWIDRNVGEREDIIRKLASMKSPAERMMLLEKTRDESASFYYRKLGDMFAGDSGSIKFDEFHPPSVDSLLNHLRLARGSADTFQARLERAAKGLVVEQGASFAFARVAGIPTELPRTIVTAFGGIAHEDRKAILSELLATARTPLKLFHLLRLYRLACECQEIETQLIDSILTSWKNIAPVFKSVLRWTDAALRNEMCWIELSFPDRLALAWVHADRITDILISANVDLSVATKVFRINLPDPPITQMMWLDPYYQIAVANIDLIEEASLLFHGFGYVFGSDDVDSLILLSQQEKIFALLTIEFDGDRTVSPWLSARFDTSAHGFNTIFSGRPNGIFEESLCPSDDACLEVFEQVLATLERTPNESAPWLAVWWFGRSGITELERGRLNVVIEKADLASLLEHKSEDDFILSVVGKCCVQLGGGNVRLALLAQMMRLASDYSSKFPDKLAWICSEEENAALAALRSLVEGVASISQSEDISESFDRFGDALAEIATAWPSSAPKVREIVENILKVADVRYTRGLWKAFVILRSL